MNILKSEAINNHIKIANLYSNIFAEQLTQTFNNIEHIASGLSVFLEEKNSDSLEEKFSNILSTNSYIRSINILDKNNQIIKSSNSKNIGVKLDITKYYPVPVFDKYILRFGDLQYGRYIALSDTKLVYIENPDLFEIQ